MSVNSSATSEGRWLLYRLLADPSRLRLLALTAEEELSVGELSEVLEELQPNVSRHAAALRQSGLIGERRQGTRSYLKLVPSALRDAVVLDAVAEGRRLCLEEGRLERMAHVVRSRDASSRAYFERGQREGEEAQLSREVPAYVLALSRINSGFELAVDVGTGDGAMLDVLAPSFRRVVAFDRSSVQLERARRRVAHRGYENVELFVASLDDRDVRHAVGDGANAVFATRVLHHSAVPRVTMASLISLLRPGGTLVVLDYATHEDEVFREQRADQWMGFSADELTGYASESGLCAARVISVPSGYVKGGPDGHIPWLLMVAQRPQAPSGKADVSKGVNRHDDR